MNFPTGDNTHLPAMLKHATSARIGTIFIICGQRQFWLGAFQSCKICEPCRSARNAHSFRD